MSRCIQFSNRYELPDIHILSFATAPFPIHACVLAPNASPCFLICSFHFSERRSSGNGAVPFRGVFWPLCCPLSTGLSRMDSSPAADSNGSTFAWNLPSVPSFAIDLRLGNPPTSADPSIGPIRGLFGKNSYTLTSSDPVTNVLCGAPSST
jgi:hypothetical protein